MSSTEYCGVDAAANDLLVNLTSGKNFDIPEVDLSGPEYQIPDFDDNELYKLSPSVTLNDLTTRTVGGKGVFDGIMESINAHLSAQYDMGRIAGSDVAKIYASLTESALANSVQFLLSKDQSYWQALAARNQAKVSEMQVVIARAQLETEKVKLRVFQYDAITKEVEYAIGKIKLSGESIAYCTAKYTLNELMPVQKDQLVAQKNLLEEQFETARAQTLDTRSDNLTPVAGMLGKQKDLYSQQIVSYQRDAETKAAKLFTDAWITMKTIDEGLTPPVNFANASLNDILGHVKANVGFV